MGKTNTCETPGWIMRFSLVMNQDKPWHFSSSYPPATSWDLQSLVTHEVGHATGFLGHFAVPSADTCNQNDATYYATMCDYDPLTKGTTKMRTLQDHDIHTLTNAYG